MNRHVVLTPAALIRPVATSWAWAGRLPLGAVSLLAGREGLGKSTLAVEMCGRLTRGNLAGDLHGRPANVIYASAEDAAASTLVPRLIAAGADLDRVHLLDVVHADDHNEERSPGALTLPEDLPEVRARAEEVGSRLIVLDPLVSYLPGDVNAHRDQHVRRVLAPLARLAEDLDLTVVAVVHLNKGDTTDVLARVGGSVGFTAAARSVVVFGRDPDDPDGENGHQRVLAHAKSNVGPLAPSLVARIEPRIVQADDGTAIPASRVVVLGETEQTARDLLAQPATGDERSARDDAVDFLQAELTDGPAAANELVAAAVAAGISKSTLDRAKKRAGVRSRKTPDGWVWELNPSNNPPDDLDDVDDLGETKIVKNAKITKIATSNGVAALPGDWTQERADALLTRSEEDA